MKKTLLLMAVLIGMGIASSSVFAEAQYWDNASYYGHGVTLNSTSTQYYNPTVAIEFNITLNDSVSGINLSTEFNFFEMNYTGTATNYTITNASYGGSVYNISFYTLPGNATYWKLYFNNTTGDYGTSWNTTGITYFTISKNATGNRVNLNLTYEGTNYIDGNITVTVDSDKYVTPQVWMNVTAAGTEAVYLNNVTAVSGTAVLTTPGTNYYVANSTGNFNYTDNATGMTFYFTTIQAGGGGSGGGGGPIPADPEADGAEPYVEPQPIAWTWPEVTLPSLPSVDPKILLLLFLVLVGAAVAYKKKK